MAWNIHWQTQFKSFNGTLYTVNVYDRDYTGAVEQLTPAAQPFTTQEDGSDDIFKPVRAQTGYLRIITSDDTLMLRMMPDTPLARFVRLMDGNTVKWQGFLSKQTYSQPIYEYKWQIEFALKSVLSMLSEVKPDIPLGIVSYREMFAAAFNYILADVPDAIGMVKTANMPMISSGVPTPQFVSHENDTPATPPTIASGLQFWEACVGNMSRYYEKYEIVDDRIHTQYQPSEPIRMFEDILRLLGACVREDGNDIIFIRYGKNTLAQQNIYSLYSVSGSVFLSGGNTYTTSFPNVPTLNVGTMLTGNRINYMKAYEEVKVEFTPDEEELVLWQLPKPFLKPSDSVDIQNYTSFLFQIPRTLNSVLSNEQFTYYDGSLNEIDYTTARNRYLGVESGGYIQGAFPMWSTSGPDDEDIETYLELYTKWSVADRHYVYSFKVNMLSANATNMNIKMVVTNTPTIYIGVINNGLYYDGNNSWVDRNVVIPVNANAQPSSTKGVANASINISGRSGEFTIIIYGRSNSTSWKSDYFYDIVVSTNSFSFLKDNYTYAYPSLQQSNFKFPLNTTNTYYKNVGKLGNMQTINLPIGTFNANSPFTNMVFVNNTYIEKFAGKRPEQYLVDVLTEYYSEKRRAITVNNLTPIAKDAYFKSNGLFFAAIETKRQWRDDKTQIKLIEMVKDN